MPQSQRKDLQGCRGVVKVSGSVEKKGITCENTRGINRICALSSRMVHVVFCFLGNAYLPNPPRAGPVGRMESRSADIRRFNQTLQVFSAYTRGVLVTFSAK